MEKVFFVYVTAASKTEAKKIGNTLVHEKLAACINIFSNITSIYRWQGKIKEDGEVVFVAKTMESKVNAIIDRVKEMHSYDCPCIVAWPLANGNRDFLKWIGEETS